MSLVLEGLGKRVGGEIHIDNINLTLEAGGFNVLLGRTTAGKTTLMRLMAGLDRPTTGQNHHGRRGRDRHAGAQTQCRHGLSAIHQLPVADGVREYRITVANHAPRPRRDRPPGARDGRDDAHRSIAAAFAGRAVGRPAAAYRDGAGAGEERPAAVVRRAVG